MAKKSVVISYDVEIPDEKIQEITEKGYGGLLDELYTMCVAVQEASGGEALYLYDRNGTREWSTWDDRAPLVVVPEWFCEEMSWVVE